MKIVKETISREELRRMASEGFGNMVKAAVDLEKGILAVEAELHSDLEALLLDAGSQQKDLWGINLYPDLQGEEFVEFDSMINIRPSQGNHTRGVADPAARKRIAELVAKKVR